MNKNRNGFALVESLLIILIIVIVAFAGYYVWNTQKSTNKINSDTVKAGQSLSSNKTAKTSTKKKLIIPEWGVEADYAGSVDLFYKLKTDDQGENWAAIDSTQMANYDSTMCGVDSQLGGIINRVKAGSTLYGPAGQSTDQTIEQAITSGALSEYSHVGDYYYYFEHPQAACGSTQTSVELQSQTTDAAKLAAKSFTAQK